MSIPRTGGSALPRPPGSAVIAAVAVLLGAPSVGAAQVGGAEGGEAGPRAFRHAVHVPAVACDVCHASEDRHRARRTWVQEDCAACHHGEDAPRAGCTSCHDRRDLVGARLATARMEMSVWDAPREREVWFDHDRHPTLACLDCHRGGMTRPPEVCASCHEDHHRDDAECELCHTAPSPAAHDLASHGSCDGGGCHTAAPRPVSSRSFCVTCHAPQREHRAGDPCDRCHVLPAAAQRPDRERAP